MTAANVFLFPSEIHVWTDGATYDAEGTLLSCNTKVVPFPHLNAVLAVRGPNLALPLLAHYLGGIFETFDGLVDGFGNAIANSVTLHGSIFDLCSHGPRFQATIAGWSERTGEPAAYRVGSDDPEGVETLGPVNIAPATDEMMAQLVAEFPTATDADLASIKIGLRLMDLQRGLRIEQVQGSGEICAVGAFAQRTVIKPTRISTEILHRWPDRVGEKIAA